MLATLKVIWRITTSCRRRYTAWEFAERCHRGDTGFFFGADSWSFFSAILSAIRPPIILPTILPAGFVWRRASSTAARCWAVASPDVVLAKLKQIKPEVFERFGLRPFYKSYIYWEKMTGEQRNKAVAWYRKLSPEIQGIAIITKV